MKNNNITKLARASLKAYLENDKEIAPPDDIDKDLLTKRAGVFVSYHKGPELRGCIGTFLPTQNNIAEEIIKNAIDASHDPRFAKIELSEIDDLKIKVDILSTPEKTDPLNLDAKKYGVLIQAKDGRKGLLLPNLEGIKTPKEQIAICRQKAGIGPQEKIEIYRFKVKRYEEK